MDISKIVKKYIDGHIAGLSQDEVSCVYDALSSYRYLKSDQFTTDIKQAIDSNLAFVRIIKIKDEDGKFIFGTKFKSTSYLQMQVCLAKNENDTWVADEDRVIMEVDMTEVAWTDLVLNNIDSEGRPVSINKLLNCKIDEETERHTDLGSQLATDLSDRKARFLDGLLNAKREFSNLVDNNVSLGKKNLEPVYKGIGDMQWVIQSNNTFSYECAAEAMAEESISIKNHVLSEVRSSLTQIHTIKPPLLLEDKSFLPSGHNPYLDYYRWLYETVGTSIIYRILNKAYKSGEIHEDDMGDVVNFLRTLESLDHLGASAQYSRKTLPPHPSHGSLKMSQRSSSSQTLFGDAYAGSKMRSTSFSLSYCSSHYDSYSRVRTTSREQIVSVEMTNEQFMDMMLSSGFGGWSKCTLLRVLKHIPENTLKKLNLSEHDKLYCGKQKKLPTEVILSECIERLKDLLSKPGSSKAKINEIFSVLDLIEKTAPDFFQERSDDFYRVVGDLTNKMSGNLIDSLSQIIEYTEGKNPKATKMLESLVKKTLAVK